MLGPVKVSNICRATEAAVSGLRDVDLHRGGRGIRVLSEELLHLHGYAGELDRLPGEPAQALLRYMLFIISFNCFLFNSRKNRSAMGEGNRPRPDCRLTSAARGMSRRRDGYNIPRQALDRHHSRYVCPVYQ